MKPPEPRPRRKKALPRADGTRAALGVFVLILIAGPLLFGAVDRVVQVVLVALLALGVFLLPPAIVPLGKWGNRLAIILLGLLVLKELAPAEWFGATEWRTVVTRDLSLDLPPTHHPEPARALDAWLAVAVGAIWFLWVRRLAAEGENRTFLAWSLFASAVAVSAVSFATRGWDSQAIYGLRLTPGWHGFGPFPNRNHTGDFLAMGALLGCGCLTWAGARKKWFALIAGGLLLGLVLLALLATQSRGGLLAFGCGLLVYFAIILLRMRSRRAVAVVAGVVLILAAVCLAFGAPVLARFQTGQPGAVLDPTRLRIWQDAATMWKDAPLLGHGVDTFQQLFPFYQSFEVPGTIALHPESSWRQWLAELGVIPVVLAVLALAAFVAHHLRDTVHHGRSFFFRAAGFSAAAALLAHAVIDVPAHRWGTAGFALAALALACPMRLEAGRFFAPRKTALVPLLVATFWTLPLFLDAPSWSPLTLARAIARDPLSSEITLEKLTAINRHFPLSADLNQSLGIREVEVVGRNAPSLWQRHFQVATQLQPSVWALPVAQARAVRPISPGLAVGYWQQAIDHCYYWQRDETFTKAVRETADAPMAAAMWARYVEAHPALLLIYAQMLPAEQGRPFAALWWKERALTAELDGRELTAFYQNAIQWNTRAQFGEWMQGRAAWRERDHRQWARLLHEWRDEKAAWQLLAEFTREPDYPALPAALARDPLESKWRIYPENLVNAQQLAAARARDGETVQAEELVLAVSSRDGAPWWFVKKAAHILARRGRTGDAVELLLKHPPPQRPG